MPDPELQRVFEAVDDKPSDAFVDATIAAAQGWPDPVDERRRAVSVRALATAAAVAVAIGGLVTLHRVRRDSGPIGPPRVSTTVATIESTSGVSPTTPTTPVSSAPSITSVAPVTLPAGVQDAQPCRAEDLTTSATDGGSATGHTRTGVTFTNVGTVPCVLSGYPGFRALDAAGAEVARGDGGPTFFGDPMPAVLAPGGSGDVAVEISRACPDGQVGTTRPARRLILSMPGGGDSTVCVNVDAICGIEVGALGREMG